MTSAEALSKVVKSFMQYYDVNKEEVISPFTAFAAFHSHEEGYFLVKKAKISEAETHEYIYFYNAEHIDADTVKRLAELAWEDGMKRVQPHSSHRNSDVSIILIGESMDDDAMKAVKKLHYSKSYKAGFNGWSNFHSSALDLSSGKLAYNRFGSDMKKVLKSITK